MRALHLAVAATAMLTAGQALAAGIDLSKPFGNKSGCVNRNGQEVYAEDMLLLTDKELITAASPCTCGQKTAQADGSLVVKAECQAEGEDGQQATQFTIQQSAKSAKGLVIVDEDGNVMGEVSRCR